MDLVKCTYIITDVLSVEKTSVIGKKPKIFFVSVVFVFRFLSGLSFIMLVTY